MILRLGVLVFLGKVAGHLVVEKPNQGHKHVDLRGRVRHTHPLYNMDKRARQGLALRPTALATRAARLGRVSRAV
jgi:hypothetical protein